MKRSTPATQGVSSDIDVVKGVLILVVIAGHNEGLMQHALWARQLFYYFNTQCFFLLSSLLDMKPFSMRLLRDRAIRYLVPFVSFLLIAWVAFVGLRGGGQSLDAAAANLLRAAVTGSEPAIHKAVGMRYLWFLPALFSLVVIKAAAIRWPTLGRGLLAAAWCLIVGAVYVPASVVAAVPCNALAGLFFFGVGEVFRRAGQAVARLPAIMRVAVAGGLTAGLAWLIVRQPLGWVAGANIRSYDITNWPTWAAALAFPCLVLATLLTTAHAWPLRRLVALCGHYSLPLYLTHMLLYRVLTLGWFGRKFDDLATVGSDLQAGMVIFVLTAAGSLAIAIGICRLPRLRRLLFPRDWPDWRLAFATALP
jgi:fucose 4-O-acetylase-like acetyltransferase